MLFVTGISGSGKSVLLRLAMGLLRPDSGQVLIEGRHIETLKESELLAIRGGLMGMVFQEDSMPMIIPKTLTSLIPGTNGDVPKRQSCKQANPAWTSSGRT